MSEVPRSPRSDPPSSYGELEGRVMRNTGWVALSLGLPFAIGYLVGGTLEAGLAGLVWGGLGRIFA